MFLLSEELLLRQLVMMSPFPVAVIVLSGKRKSGKDYLADCLKKRLGERQCSILRLSAPLKFQYAQEHGLDFDRLLDASEYKELYRSDMIRWGEEKRNQDPGFFCRLICKGEGSDKPIWIISDARRKTDVGYFESQYKDKLIKIRVTASEEIRKTRGWEFKTGVDDAESECGLDSGVKWDHVIENNGGTSSVADFVNSFSAELLKKIPT